MSHKLYLLRRHQGVYAPKSPGVLSPEAELSLKTWSSLCLLLSAVCPLGSSTMQGPEDGSRERGEGMIGSGQRRKNRNEFRSGVAGVEAHHSFSTAALTNYHKPSDLNHHTVLHGRSPTQPALG